MSRTGYYVLHIYCDNPTHRATTDNHGATRGAMPEEFDEATIRLAYLMARRAGWRRVKGKDYCPKCSGKGKP